MPPKRMRIRWYIINFCLYATIPRNLKNTQKSVFFTLQTAYKFGILKARTKDVMR